MTRPASNKTNAAFGRELTIQYGPSFGESANPIVAPEYSAGAYSMKIPSKNTMPAVINNSRGPRTFSEFRTANSSCILEPERRKAALPLSEASVATSVYLSLCPSGVP
jgi:hypothetical protein